eukprot:TRINITY_DN9308_c0_g1_i2.p1 TRINITY_DN9308_c0_g1~~TRINITY_DN9308_c0_g1_i2.p1  ORF type:complete len:528 (+),score=153.41 TRINITY_DN9308_c0_g1_i2:76-1584(+)
MGTPQPADAPAEGPPAEAPQVPPLQRTGDEAVAAAKLRLRALALRLRRGQLEQLGAELQGLHKALLKTELELRRPGVDSTQRSLLKQQECQLLGSKAAAEDSLAHLRQLQSDDFALSVLLPQERRAARRRKKEAGATGGQLRTEAAVSEEYAGALRGALIHHRAGGDFVLPPTPEHSPTEAVVAPQDRARFRARPSAVPVRPQRAPRKGPTQRRRDPSDGRFKSRAEFMKSGHSAADWARAETIEHRRMRLGIQTHRRWAVRKTAEQREQGRAIFDAERKLREAAEPTSPGQRGAGPRKAAMLRNAVVSGAVSKALRRSGMKGVRALVGALLQTEDVDRPAEDPAAEPPATPPHKHAVAVVPAPVPEPPAAGAEARAKGGAGRRPPWMGGNPFAAADIPQALPEGWPAAHPVSASAPVRRVTSAVRPPPPRGASARTHVLDRFGLSADELGRLRWGWTPPLRLTGPGDSSDSAGRQLPPLSAGSPRESRSCGVPEPDERFAV